MFEEEGAEGAEGVEGGAADTGSGAGTGAAPEWDGSKDTLEAQPWWSTVPEGARSHLTKTWDDLAAATVKADMVAKLLDSDDAVAELRAQLQTKDTEFATLKAALDKATAEVGEYRTKAEQEAARAEDIEADREFDRLEAKYPDIFKDVYYTDAEKKEVDPSKGAFPRFLALRKAGWSEEDAATAASTLVPKVAAQPAEPAPRERAPVPASIKATSQPGNSAATVVDGKSTMSYEQAMRKLKAEAEREENGG